MKKIPALILFVAFILSSCSKVPVIGRQQINLISDAELNQASFQQYRDFLDTSTVISSTANAAMVNTVGSRLSTATNEYLNDNGYQDLAQSFKWEYHLVQNSEANAWCMPGGKIAVYSGIIPVTQSEEGLAVVLGHEIAHAVARHGAERLSEMMAVQLGGVALSVALSQKPQQTQDLINIAYGITANYAVILPFSRKHELEADKLGLIFMALGGYDPRNAVDFWQRMASMSQGQPPEFLSTHPAYNTRINAINNYMNTALKYYKPS